jgi:hypothetical protein
VGGRSGFGSVLAVLAVGLFAIGLALVRFSNEFVGSFRITSAYSAYAVLSIIELLRMTVRLAGYRSSRAASPPPLVFEIRE